jgi:hypothetical protein
MGMSIVANIDNLMALTITNSAISEEMGSDPIYFNKQQKSWRGDLQEMNEWRSYKDMGPLDWVAGVFMLIFHRVFKTFYVCAYFYFTPFLVCFMLDCMIKQSPPIIYN